MDENNNSKDMANEDLNNTEEIIETNDIPVSNEEEVTTSDDSIIEEETLVTDDSVIEEEILVTNDSVIEEEIIVTDDSVIEEEIIVTNGSIPEKEILLPSDSPKEVKKSISPKLIGLGALVLAIILIAVFVLNSPKRKVASALVKTSKSIEKTVSNFDTPDGYFNTVKKLSADSYSSNITFAEDSPIAPPSFGLYFDSLSLINDKKNKQASLDIGLSGENYFSTALSNEVGYVSLAENSYSFNPKTFGSEFVEWSKDNQKYFDFDLLEVTGMTETSLLTYDELIKKFSSSIDFLKYQNTILKNATFASEKVSYLIDDAETSGEKINVTLNPEDIKATLIAIKTDNPSYPLALEDINALEINESTASFTIVKGLVYSAEYNDGTALYNVSSNNSEPARKFKISNVIPNGNITLDFENLLAVNEKGFDYHVALKESDANFANVNFTYAPALQEDNLKIKLTLFLMGTEIDISLNSIATTEESRALLNFTSLVFGSQESMPIKMTSVVEKYTDKFEIPVGDSNLFDHSYPAILGYDENLDVVE